MDQHVILQHEEDLSFNVQIDGHNFKIDSVGEFGGKNRGPRPKTLMLAALGGCTGMDVASIMKKMKIPFEDFSVEVTGVLTDEHPKHFKKMHLIFSVKGKDLDRNKIEKAVNLSQDRYCGVTHSYKASMEISHEIIIEE
ncbi:MAG: OsmC family protein [Bacteroidota bacterium]